MRTIDTDLLVAKGCFAAVAGAVYSHADRFRHSGRLKLGGGFPWVWAERQAIFGEESAGPFIFGGAGAGHNYWGWFNRFPGQCGCWH